MNTQAEIQGYVRKPWTTKITSEPWSLFCLGLREPTLLTPGFGLHPPTVRQSMPVVSAFLPLCGTAMASEEAETGFGALLQIFRLETGGLLRATFSLEGC